MLSVEQRRGKQERDFGSAGAVGAVGVLDALKEVLFLVAVMEADDGGDADGRAAQVGDGAADVEGPDGDGLPRIGDILAFKNIGDRADYRVEVRTLNPHCLASAQSWSICLGSASGFSRV